MSDSSTENVLIVHAAQLKYSSRAFCRVHICLREQRPVLKTIGTLILFGISHRVNHEPAYHFRVWGVPFYSPSHLSPDNHHQIIVDRFCIYTALVSSLSFWNIQWFWQVQFGLKMKVNRFFLRLRCSLEGSNNTVLITRTITNRNTLYFAKIQFTKIRSCSHDHSKQRTEVNAEVIIKCPRSFFG